MIHQQTEAALGEVVMVALQQVAAKLIHHNDDHNLGLCVVSAGKGGDGPQAEYEESDGTTNVAAHKETSVIQSR